MSIRQGGNILAASTNGHWDLLDWKWTDHLLDDVSWLRADTFSWQPGSVYTPVYNHLDDDIDGKTLTSETVAGVTVQFYLADDGHKICPASEESNVVSIYTATGVAWYYIIDTVNQRFKLPRTQFGVTGLRDTVGNYVAPGLPNITGTLSGLNNTLAANLSGAFSTSSVTGSAHITSSSGNNAKTSFDASRSNSIYGNSTTVQSPATQMYLYFYVGNFTRTALENTAGINAEALNNKVDLDGSWGAPSSTYEDATVGAHGAYYTAPADGWFTLYITSSTAIGLVLGLRNDTNQMLSTAYINTTNGRYGVVMPVSKGQRVQAYHYNMSRNIVIRFVYAQKTN